jgi:four helix bundle protein
MGTQNLIKEKSIEFALSIISLCDERNRKNEFVLSKRLLRSGTSIVANISESRHAENRADFIHKLSISLKEAYESEYWLLLLFESKKIDQNRYSQLAKLNSDLINIRGKIILTSKRRKKSN